MVVGALRAAHLDAEASRWQRVHTDTRARARPAGQGLVRVEDDQLPFYPVYDSTPQAAQAVIGECYAFEYYLIAKDLSWLLCENHHDTLIGVGDEVRRRMAAEGA